MSTALELVQEIEKLPPSERVRMIDRVIRSTIKPDVELEKIWIKEASARWHAFERGEIETIPYETVMARWGGDALGGGHSILSPSRKKFNHFKSIG